MEFGLVPQDYEALLGGIKERVRQAQARAVQAVNSELVLLYWQIGREILRQQREQGWGSKVIERLSRDLRREFPEMKGLSPRNINYMRAFAEAYPDEPFVQQVVAQMPWGHNVRLLEQVKSAGERLWYARQAIEHGWSRDVLVHQIEAGLYQRQGQAVTNFERTLPAPQSDLAAQVLKDPYVFDFLSLGPEARERDLERALVRQLRDFLLELGRGFAFIGNQYHLEVGGEDFFLDLLFYHVRLRCYMVIELKVCEFRPEFVGKMNFYLSAVDELLRHPDDQPSIGLILCKTRNRLIVEYTLRDTRKPMGVATYQITATLPDELRSSLPSVEELEAELGRDEAQTS
jgi:predicted nuclease of restriction endonuclease-like (RecB) superfamily